MNGVEGSDKVMEAVTARLPSGVAVRVEAATDSVDGMRNVAHVDLDLGKALDSIGEISAVVVEKLKKAKPTKATVELKLGFAVESGKLTALWVGGKGEASLAVRLEWSGDAGAGGDGSDDGDGGSDGGSDDG